MRFPDRPLVTAGLGVAFALLILLALSSPTLFQTVMTPSSNGPSSPNASLQVSSATVTMSSTIGTGAHSPIPNGTASTATDSGTTSSTAAVPNSLATNSTSTNFSVATTAATMAGTITSATSASAPTTSATMYFSTSTVAQVTTIQDSVTPVTTVQSTVTPASASTNSQGLFSGGTFSPTGSSLYVFAYKLSIIGTVALVIALMAAFMVYRKVNAAG